MTGSEVKGDGDTSYDSEFEGEPESEESFSSVNNLPQEEGEELALLISNLVQCVYGEPNPEEFVTICF